MPRLGCDRRLGRDARRPVSPASRSLEDTAWRRHAAPDGRGLCLGNFLDAMAVEGETVHIDGKRLRGAGRDGTVHHLVEALCGSQGIGLVETGAGAEGPAIQELVPDLDLAGRLVTLDAAGTTPAVAAAVRSRGADFLLAVEPNQRSLLDAMRPAFDQTAGPAHTTKDRGHGR